MDSESESSRTNGMVNLMIVTEYNGTYSVLSVCVPVCAYINVDDKDGFTTVMLEYENGDKGFIGKYNNNNLVKIEFCGN